MVPHGTMPFDGDDQSPSPAVRERRSRLDPVFRDILSQVLCYDVFQYLDRIATRIQMYFLKC